MNIREITKLAPNYCEINREERNYAAIFFAALCKPGNSERFLNYCGYNETISPDFGIFFEYSYLRDLWYNISDENIKKEIIRHHLKITNIDDILALPTIEINLKFGVGGEPSEKFIQYPGKWAIVKYSKNFTNPDDFLKICKFKWSFNIKPDIVIHLDKDRAICIEAKYESGEGSYPASDIEKAIFKEKGLLYVGQMKLQEYMMNTLLGLETKFIRLDSKKNKSETHQSLTWSEAFGLLDMSEMPPFANVMAKNTSILSVT